MQKQLKIVMFLFLSFFIIDSYAIQVSVQSPSNNVYALGFTVNGKKFGGAGKSYSNSNLPTGMYTFGVRVGGLFGTDVGCSYKGKQSVQLNRDTVVGLYYNGRSCIARIR